MFNEQNQATTFVHMNANREAKVGVGRLLWNGNNWLGVWLLHVHDEKKEGLPQHVDCGGIVLFVPVWDATSLRGFHGGRYGSCKPHSQG